MSVAKQNTPDNYVFGRPAEYDIKKYADDIDEWSKTDEATSIRKWFIKCDLDPSYAPKWSKIDKNFGQKYKLAKLRIAERREEMLHNGEMDYAHYNRHQFFYEVVEDEHEEAKKDKEHERKKDLLKLQAELANETTKQVSDDLTAKFDAVMTQISSSQSKRKTADNSNKTDCKS